MTPTPYEVNVTFYLDAESLGQAQARVRADIRNSQTSGYAFVIESAVPDPLPQRSTWGATCCQALVVHTGEPLLAQEYIAEAEHQDGYAYWEQFQSIMAVLDDFAEYLSALEK